MKLAGPMRLVLLGGVLAAVSAVGLLASALTSQTTEAHDVAGEYALEVRVTDTAGVDLTAAATGDTFEVRASIQYGGTSPTSEDDCFVVVPPEGCYQASQWNIDYDEAGITGITCSGAIECTNIARISGSPSSGCASESDNAERWLVGCLNTDGPFYFYEGEVFRITTSCTDAGTFNFTLTTGGQASFVGIGTDPLPFHLHDDSITCTGTASTPTPDPTATAVVTNTPVVVQATPTFVTRRTNTPTTVPTGTPDPNATPSATGGTPPPPPPPPPPGDGGTGPVVGSPTRTGSGVGAGNLRPPDTGNGGLAGDSAAVEWIWLALGATGLALSAAGGVTRWRRGR